MRIRIVDAFSERPFAGNPAGVVLLDSGAFPDDTWLQQVAAEVNLAETAFAHPLPEGGDADWALRWLTPVAEVDMCGHATLATAHVLHSTGTATGTVRFRTRSGVLTTTVGDGGAITMDFPTAPLTAGRGPGRRQGRAGCGDPLRTRHRPPGRRSAGRAGRREVRTGPLTGLQGAGRTRRPGRHRHRAGRGPRRRLRLRLALLLPRRGHRRGPRDGQRAHRARPVLVRAARARQPRRPPGSGSHRLRTHHAPRRAHPC